MRIICFTIILMMNSLLAQSNRSSKAFLRFGGACGNNSSLNNMSNPLIESAKKDENFKVYDSYHGGPESRIKVSTAPKITKGDKEVPNPQYDKPKYNYNEYAHGGEEHLNSKLESMWKQFEEKDCTKEDCQVIINLPAHGYPTDTFSMAKAGFRDIKKKHHGICMANGKKLSIDHFKPHLERLKNKGVKIAVITEACFSGETAEVLGDYACVLTSTGSHIPHTNLSENDNPMAKAIYKHQGYGAAIKNLQNNKPISMTDLAIENLLNTTAGGMLNVPIISNPEGDDFLKKLNNASNIFTLKKTKKLYKQASF